MLQRRWSKAPCSGSKAVQSLGWLVRYLFGPDVFISYARADGTAYALALRDRLGARGLSCTLDLLASWPGAFRATDASAELAIPTRLRRQLARSSMLVVVATRGAADSSAVEAEIRAFLAENERRYDRRALAWQRRSTGQSDALAARFLGTSHKLASLWSTGGLDVDNCEVCADKAELLRLAAKRLAFGRNELDVPATRVTVPPN